MTIPVLLEYFPVNTEARYGAQTGLPDTALQKLILSLARQSMFGVRARAFPANPHDENRN